jgi:ATP-dependent RNA helicase SUPV3L1/SUV3
LCGDERALSLIKKLCALTGDILISREYKRLNELHTETKVVDLKSDLKEGDCLITFTVNEAQSLQQVDPFFIFYFLILIIET